MDRSPWVWPARSPTSTPGNAGARPGPPGPRYADCQGRGVGNLRRTIGIVCLPALGWLAALAWAQPGDGDWRMAAHDPANTRYSPLAQITPANAAGLREVFSFVTGTTRGHEGAPVVVGDTMVLQAPYPNTVFALD